MDLLSLFKKHKIDKDKKILIYIFAANVINVTNEIMKKYTSYIVMVCVTCSVMCMCCNGLLVQEVNKK